MNDADKKLLAKLNLQRVSAGTAAPDPAREAESLRALSDRFGIPGVDLAQVCLRLADLELLPREIAERRLMLPLSSDDERLFVAMADPGDRKMIDELEFVTAKRVFAYVAVPEALERVIGEAYDARIRGESFYVGPRCPAEVRRKMGAGSSEHPPAGPAVTERIAVRPASVAPPAVEAAAARDELSYAEFGDTSRELSVVAPLPGEPQRASATSRMKTVLIVDDEPEIRKMLKRVLGDRGHHVIEADRGLEALRMVKTYVPDLIVLDAMLPEVHGFDIARRIKGSAKYGHIPIVMVSAVYRGWRAAEDAKTSYGVDEFIEKPFRLADVVQAVERRLTGPVPAPATMPAGPGPHSTVARSGDGLSEDAERHLNAGVEAYRGGDVDAAIEHLRLGLAIDPLAFRLHFHLGLLYGKKGFFFEAIGELERATELNAQHFPAVKNLAVLYQKVGLRQKAQDAWQRALETAPDAATRESIREHLAGLGRAG